MADAHRVVMPTDDVVEPAVPPHPALSGDQPSWPVANTLLSSQCESAPVAPPQQQPQQQQQPRKRMVFATPPLRLDTSNSSLQLPQAATTTPQPRQWTPQHCNLSETSELLPRTASPSSHGSSSTRLQRSSSQQNTHNCSNLPCSRTMRWKRYAHDALQALSCILIATLLNLMICVPFGLSFFPVEWHDMPVPRALGIQMFLLTTAICQFVFVARSEFDGAIGMMMVENVPFMHTLSLAIIRDVGSTSDQALPTILVTYALSSIVVGALFFILGHYKLGNVIYLFPKHIIVGAIGGIGAFVLQNGVENATGRAFEWTHTGVVSLFESEVVWLWVTSALLALTLSIATRWIKSPLFPPLFFVSIPPLFYVALVILRIPPATARDAGWFFDKAPDVAFYTLWREFDFARVAWHVIPKQFGTIVGLTIFSLMHVPINIPSLSLTTDREVDINVELVAHGLSNALGGVAGSVQNYLCYSTSALYYKCGGRGRASGTVIGVLMLYFFFIGPSAVAYVPRCMAGCLMIHIGLDLLREALIDTYDELDALELGTVWVIAATMTFWGMNQGLAIGALLACATFVVQAARTPTNAPIRGSMSAATFRSSVWRPPEALDVLDLAMRTVHVVQLKGHLFFGNANTLSEYVRTLFAGNSSATATATATSLAYSSTTSRIQTLVLDFTLVVGLDSSAADRLTKIKSVCDQHACRVVFAAIPAAYSRFTDHLIALFGDARSWEATFHVATDLNAALAWCEHQILQAHAAAAARLKQPIAELLSDTCDSDDDECRYLQTLQRLMPNQPLSSIHRLLEYFVLETIEQDTIVWHQNDVADKCLLLVDGHLRAVIEEEAGTTEDVAIGAVVGELCFLTGEKRKTTLVATQRSVVYVLDRSRLDDMLTHDCYLAFLFQGVALRYTSSRMQYVGNRIWETKCVPI